MSTVTIEQLHKFHDEISKGRITRELLQAFLENPSRFVTKDLLSSATIAAKYGYTVVEDVAPSTFKVSDLKFKSFLERGESYISGETMRQRAVSMKGNPGLVDGQYLLEYQAEIPVYVRGKCIVLAGTLLRGSDGRLFVPFLFWGGGRWYLRFGWLGDDWNDSDRFACSE